MAKNVVTQPVSAGLAERLKGLRAIVGLSAREIDRLAGLREGHTSFIECGNRKHVEARTIAKFAQVFGASMDWLFNGEGRAPSEAAVRRAVADSQGLKPTGTDP